jgi:hypothetical protein
MKCPHCLVAFNDEQSHKDVFEEYDQDGFWEIERRRCPECDRLILHLRNKNNSHVTKSFVLMRPRASERPCPAEVPVKFSEDFKEASLVLSDSPKASAALSRRCLQNLLREESKTLSKDLADQIEEIIVGNLLPSYLAEDLDAVRNIGNFAAHPIKSKQTGEVLPVESGEAEWNLDVLEALFDFYFVQPEQNKKRKSALNLKLKEAGKPEIK